MPPATPPNAKQPTWGGIPNEKKNSVGGAVTSDAVTSRISRGSRGARAAYVSDSRTMSRERGNGRYHSRVRYPRRSNNHGLSASWHFRFVSFYCRGATRGGDYPRCLSLEDLRPVSRSCSFSVTYVHVFLSSSCCPGCSATLAIEARARVPLNHE